MATGEAAATAEGLGVERAYSDRHGFVGYRLTVAGHDDYRLLVWADQSVMKGFRVGDAFTPGVGESIRYVPCRLEEGPVSVVLGAGATGLSDRCHGYIDERYGIDADEVLVMSKAKDATP